MTVRDDEDEREGTQEGAADSRQRSPACDSGCQSGEFRLGGVFSNRSNLVFNKVVVIFEVCPARDGN